jgi:hypothetical protein
MFLLSVFYLGVIKEKVIVFEMGHIRTKSII